MAILHPSCKEFKCSLTLFALIVILLSPTYCKETSLPPISFDEAEVAIPILPASLQVVDIRDGPPNNQQNPLVGEGEHQHTNSPAIISNEAGAQQATIDNNKTGEEIASQLLWIIVIACSVVIIGGIAVLLGLRCRKKDKKRAKLQYDSRNHIELQEVSQPSLSDIVSR